MLGIYLATLYHEISFNDISGFATSGPCGIYGQSLTTCPQNYWSVNSVEWKMFSVLSRCMLIVIIYIDIAT